MLASPFQHPDSGLWYLWDGPSWLKNHPSTGVPYHWHPQTLISEGDLLPDTGKQSVWCYGCLSDDTSASGVTHWSFKRGLFRDACCCCLGASVVSDSVWPYGLQPARLLCPGNSLGNKEIAPALKGGRCRAVTVSRGVTGSGIAS